VAALAEMYVQPSFAASAISSINQRLEQNLAHFAAWPLSEAFPNLMLDASYERVREVA
jgi:transposase-like protein